MSEWDITVPRAPSEARKIKNPIEPSPEVIEQGKRLYLGKGDCHICHGVTGRGEGDSGKLLNPPPRDFTSERFQLLRTDGELYWVIVNGSPGTGMFSYAPRMISEEEAWMVIHYIRTLKEKEGT
jgi:mono/diheme cytochrome c family protein